MDGNGEHLVYPGREISRPNRAQDAGALGTGSEGGRQPERLQQLRRLTAAIWRRGCVTATDAFPQATLRCRLPISDGTRNRPMPYKRAIGTWEGEGLRSESKKDPT